MSELNNRSIDLIICSSGYESRGTSFLRHFNNIDSKKVVFGFKEHKDNTTRICNDENYKEYGFVSYEVTGNSNAEVSVLVQRLLNDIKQDICNVIIDVSTMTRSWYGSIIHTLFTEDKFKQINACFTYRPVVYSHKIYEYPPNEIVSPVPGYSGLGLFDKPIALIIGLGTDKGRAMGLKELLDSKLTLVFYPDPGTDKRFLEELKDSNKDILSVLARRNKHSYSVYDCENIFNVLESVSTGLIKDYSVVMASLGPKIFGLCCFLISTRYPEMSVWRISAGRGLQVEDRKASKHSILLDTTWILNLENS